MENKVKEYLQRQSLENRNIIKKLMKMILTNFPDISETTMAEGLWYEGKFYITAFRDHVNLGVSINELSKEESDLFLGNGKTMRHLKFYRVLDIKEKELLALMSLVYKKSRCDCNFKWKNN